MSREYLNFDILVEHVQDEISARVISSPAGEAAVRFALPDELSTVATSAAQWSSEAVQSAGTALFRAVFSGELLACYRSSCAEASRRGKGLRLRFRLGDAPDLAWVPWELLKDPLRGFLGQSTDTTIVRYLELPEVARPPKLKLPLRILALLSSPQDVNYDPIDVDRERRALQSALGPLQARGQVTIEFLEDARLEVLHERLQTGDFHVLHFVGHSGVDSTNEEGIVVLETSGGRGRPVPATVFRTLLADRDLRLVVLNSCESARPGSRGLFSGVAQALVQGGIPAVVAMQFPIRDDAASQLATPFYRELALSRPVDAAVAEARKSVASLGGAVWATPVVFLRARDGRIFEPPQPPLRERLFRAVPHALLTLNWLLLLFAIKQVRFYFTDWRWYLAAAAAVPPILELLARSVPAANWRDLALGWLRRSDGRLRPLAAGASLLLSTLLVGAVIWGRPHVDMEEVSGDIAAGEKKLRAPQLGAVVSQRSLCGISGLPSDKCDEPLPKGGYLRLQYHFRYNSVSTYHLRLTLEPEGRVEFAHLRTDPVFDVTAGVGRVGFNSKNEIWIASAGEADVGTLGGDIELRVVARAKPPGKPPTPTLRASFATDRRGEEVVRDLEICWSLDAGARVECGPRDGPSGR